MRRYLQLALRIALAVGILSLAPASSPADSLTKMSGRVLNAQNQPIAGALVIARSAANVEMRARTGKDGEFVLLGLEYGPVQFIVEAPNYNPCPSSSTLESGEDLHATYTLSSAVVAVQTVRELSRQCTVQSWRGEPFDRYVIH